MKIKILSLIGALAIINLFVACDDRFSEKTKTDVINQNLQGKVKKITSSCFEVKSKFGKIEKIDYISFMDDHPFKYIDDYAGSSAFEMEFSKKGNRWYDNDPMMLKGVELLRNAPANIQRVAALKLLVALEQKSFEGIEI